MDLRKAGDIDARQTADICKIDWNTDSVVLHFADSCPMEISSESG
jgi:hypothetical protein